jgi:hypothetical protein
LKLSPGELQRLTSSPGSIPLRPATPLDDDIPPLANGLGLSVPGGLAVVKEHPHAAEPKSNGHTVVTSGDAITGNPNGMKVVNATPGALVNGRPGKASRSVSSPIISRKQSSFRGAKPAPLKLDNPPREASSASARLTPNPEHSQPSPMPPIIPMPPLSLPTYLQLELSSDRPSPLYIHRSASSDFPYESSKVKFERLLNFLRLPPGIWRSGMPRLMAVHIHDIASALLESNMDPTQVVGSQRCQGSKGFECLCLRRYRSRLAAPSNRARVTTLFSD